MTEFISALLPASKPSSRPRFCPWSFYPDPEPHTMLSTKCTLRFPCGYSRTNLPHTSPRLRAREYLVLKGGLHHGRRCRFPIRFACALDTKKAPGSASGAEGKSHNPAIPSAHLCDGIRVSIYPLSPLATSAGAVLTHVTGAGLSESVLAILAATLTPVLPASRSPLPSIAVAG